jgi:hypothetical protein
MSSLSPRQRFRLIAIPIGLALCVLALRSEKVAGLATILLLYVTLEYVLANQESLELLKHQSERQEKVFLHFDLVCKDVPLFVRVANLGISNFLVTGIHVRTQDLAKFFYSIHQVVESGKSEEIPLPRDVCANHPLSVDLEITLDYVGLDVRGSTEPKCFNVSMGLDEIPIKVAGGLDGLWPVMCPKCHFGGMLFMSVRNLTTFAEAEARKRQLVTDLGNSCPNHQSEWLMGMDDVSARRKIRG